MLNKLEQVLKLTRQRAAEGHLSFGCQLLEMAALRMLRGVGPRYYHTAGFWRREIPWRDKLDHPSAREYRRVVRAYNPPLYRKLSQNKIAEKAILALFQLPTPRFLGRINRTAGLDHRNRPLICVEDLANLIYAEAADRLVFKKLEGYGGKGVQIAQIQRGSNIFCRPVNRKDFMPLADYCEQVLELADSGDWLVEEYFNQHPALASLNPTSVNTVRIWILEKMGGAKSQMVTAYTRIGRVNMFVDNASSGGIVAPIDLSTGVLNAARDAHAERRIYPVHPDHGAAILGVALPYWKQIQVLARRALRAFPQLHFAGLDVAVGESGPVVLELNVSPDREAAAYTDCPTVPFFK
jgi:Sugar-transfer associated ATP-grasp